MNCPECAAANSEYNANCAKCGAILPQSLVRDLDLDAAPPPVTANPDEPDSIPRQLLHFRIERKVGEGGMGTVYKAWDLDLDRPVALKMIRRDFIADQDDRLQQLLAEAKAASALNHPNIVTIFGVFRQPDQQFIAMEWVEGQTLVELIPPAGLEPEPLLDYALGIAKGLASAHENHLIHRDVKPGNIMVGAGGTVKVLDFGLARPVATARAAPGNREQTRYGVIKGTPAYMSPEQARGETLDARSDVFSFGLLLHQMCTGVHPFADRPNEDILELLQRENPPPARTRRADLHPDLEALMLACLEREREARPAHMGVVVARLRAMRLPDPSLPASPPTPRLRRLAKSPWAAGLLGLLAILLLFDRLKILPSPQPALELHALAVMPMDNLTGDPALDITCDGLAATVNMALARAADTREEVWIVPPGELRRLEKVDTETLHQRFGVGHAIATSLQYAGQGLHLRVSLIRTKTLEELRSTELEIGAEALFAHQEQLVQAVFDMLDWPLPNRVRRDLPASPVAGAHQLYLKGLSYSYRGDRPGNFARAESALLKALSLDPEHVATLVALAETYRLMWTFEKTPGSIERGLDYGRKALALRDDLAVVHVALGYLLAEQGDYPASEQSFRAALSLQHSYGSALYGLGRTLGEAGRFAEAEQAFLRANTVNPYDWLGQSEFGYLYYNQGKMAEAERVFRHLVALAPGNLRSQSNLAVLLYSNGQIEEALDQVDRGLAIGPDEMLFTTKGNIEFFLGHYDLAAQAFRQAIAINSDFYVHYGNLGDTLRQLGQLEQAVAAYAQAVALAEQNLAVKPGDGELNIMIVHYLARSGQLAQARQRLNRLEPPVGSSLIYWHALAAELLGERTKALTLLQQALALNYPLAELSAEPDLKALRKDPRFLEIMAQSGHKTQSEAPGVNP